MRRKANMGLVVVLLVLAAGAFLVAGQGYARVASAVALSNEASAAEDAVQARWQALLATAVVVDASAPLSVPAGSLVVATGALTPDGALRDDVLGVERPKALTLQRKLWRAEHTTREVASERWDPVRRPSDARWRSANDGIARREVKLVGGVRWQLASPGTPRAEGAAIGPGELQRAANARVGLVPLSPALVLQVPESPVPLPAEVTALPQVQRTTAALVDEVTLQLGDGRADSFRVVLVERASDEVTVLGRFDGAALATWQPDGTDDSIGQVLPGRRPVSDFMPSRSDAVAAGPSSVWAALVGEPARLGLVGGGVVLGCFFLVLALVWRP